MRINETTANLFYEIDPEDDYHNKQYGRKYVVQYGVNLALSIDSNFEPHLSCTKQPTQHLLWFARRIWAEWNNRVEYIKFDKHQHLADEDSVNTLPDVDLKEFTFVKLSAKEIS